MLLNKEADSLFHNHITISYVCLTHHKPSLYLTVTSLRDDLEMSFVSMCSTNTRWSIVKVNLNNYYHPNNKTNRWLQSFSVKFCPWIVIFLCYKESSSSEVQGHLKIKVIWRSRLSEDQGHLMGKVKYHRTWTISVKVTSYKAILEVFFYLGTITANQMIKMMTPALWRLLYFFKTVKPKLISFSANYSHH